MTRTKKSYTETELRRQYQLQTKVVRKTPANGRENRMETKTTCFVSAEKTQSETPFGGMFALLQQGELSDFESHLYTTEI